MDSNVRAWLDSLIGPGKEFSSLVGLLKVVSGSCGFDINHKDCLMTGCRCYCH